MPPGRPLRSCRRDVAFRRPSLRRELAACVLTALAVGGCTLEQRTDRQPVAAAESPRRQVITPEGVARLPVFSHAIRSGDLIFLSGQLGALPGVNPPQLVEGGIEAETRQTFDNITAVLAAAGATLEDLVKCTVFLADIDDYAAMNAVYIQYFAGDPPARAALAATGLALGALVEIDCIAAVPQGS